MSTTKTSIEWTDRSVNPLRARLGVGSGHYCEKVSPGCKNCYSSRLQPRFRMPQFQEQRRLGVEHFLDVSKLEDVLRLRKPSRIFWCDMTDMFGEWVSNEQIAACFGVMAATPHHTHQVLTKRAARMAEWFAWLQGQQPKADYPPAPWWTAFRCVAAAQAVGVDFGKADLASMQWPLPNVWLGVSAEDQQRWNERMRFLHTVPAAVHFASLEPLLGPIDLKATGRIHLSWTIVGGESGQAARPCDVSWIESIVTQCAENGIPCFVKQLGAHVRDRNDAGFLGEDGDRWDIGGSLDAVEHDPDGERNDYQGAPVRVHLQHSKGGEMAEWPEALRVRQFPEVRA